MTIGSQPVSVRRLPAYVCHESAKAFLFELRSSAETGRPRIVLECSTLRVSDQNSMHLLLCSLEEAMKHKGDVKLVGIQDEVKAVFESTGINRLFEFFETEEDAVSSFQRISSACAKQRVAGNEDAQESAHTISYAPLLVPEMVRSEQ